MRDETRVAIGRVMAGTSIATAVIGLGWLIVQGRADRLFEDWVIHNGIVALGFGTIGLLVVPHQPRNGVVWVGLWSALATGVYCTMMALLYSTLDAAQIGTGLFDLAPSQIPLGASIPGNLTSWLYLPGIYLPLTLGFLLFPDGRLPNRRWAWARWASIVGIVAMSAILAYAFRPSSDLTYSNSVEPHPSEFLDAIGPLWTNVFIFLNFAFIVVILSALAALVVRYRRSEGPARKQFLWVIWGASVLVALLMPAAIWDTVSGGADGSRYALAIGLVVLIGSYGVAIGKYRLYDVDVVINRTVVLAILASFITLVYASIVVGLGNLLAGDGQGLVLPIAATGVIALAFEPVRHRAQKWANRLVYGRRATPYEVLGDLTRRLSDSEEGVGILARMAAGLGDGTGAERTTIWLGSPGMMVAGASWPEDAVTNDIVDFEDDSVFPVVHDGEVVGAFEVVKARGTDLSSAERALVIDLAGSAGAVLGYQRLNDALAERALELERSRHRLLEAQDAERRRLERSLHDGAQQQIVGLKVKIDLAARSAAAHGAADLAQLLNGLANEAQQAVDEVSSLARGIYPPVLRSDGLPAALAGLAAAAPVDVVFTTDGVGRYEPEVEAAIYFDISEAVTNAVKHGLAPISVDLKAGDGRISFEVRDSGPGFDTSSLTLGSGLANMADRLDAIGGRLKVESSPGSGTVVEGSVPIPALV
jgi:signal transduction histidine kinase